MYIYILKFIQPDVTGLVVKTKNAANRLSLQIKVSPCKYIFSAEP